jgi:hypothetical protein
MSNLRIRKNMYGDHGSLKEMMKFLQANSSRAGENEIKKFDYEFQVGRDFKKSNNFFDHNTITSTDVSDKKNQDLRINQKKRKRS